MSDDGERDIPARVRAFNAAIGLAVETAHDSGYFSARFTSADVVDEAEGDVSGRSARRALGDAAAMGWVAKKRQQWESGPRAEEAAGVEGDEIEKVTVCNDCETVWRGRTTYCEDCGSDWVRQVEPRD